MVEDITQLPNLQTIARLLGGRINSGEVLCPGPDHSKGDASLSVKPNPNAPGGFLVHSFAKDDPIVCRDYVREKLGLPAFKLNGGRPRFTDADIQRAVMKAAEARPPKARPTAAYSYPDENGTLLYQVLRYGKGQIPPFRQRRPDGNGGWKWGLDENDENDNIIHRTRRVLYRLPELLRYPSNSPQHTFSAEVG